MDNFDKNKVQAIADVLRHSVITFGGIEQTSLPNEAADSIQDLLIEVERLSESNAELLEIVDRDTRTIETANDKLTAAQRVKDEVVERMERIARDRGGNMGEYHAECQQIARAFLTQHGGKA